MKNGKLILYPMPPETIPDSSANLVKALHDIGFLASPLEAVADTRYLAGDRFLQLITFLGCSPQVELIPKKDGSLAFCHVSIAGPCADVRFVAGDGAVPPRCPNCGSKDPEWQRTIAAWREHPAGFRWNCPSCGTASGVARLDWRKGAGFGRFFVVVHNIFPGEAVPGEELLGILETSTSTAWGFFYATGLSVLTDIT